MQKEEFFRNAVQGESGFLSLNGEPDGEPVKAPTFLSDELSALQAAGAFGSR